MGAGGGASSSGPSPEVLGLAAFLAAVVGLGSLWILTSRRRRRGSAPAPVRTRAEVAATASDWTNVRLDDNDALPPWLRAIPQAEHDPAMPSELLFAIDPPHPDESAEAAPEEALPPRLTQTFLGPLEPGAMRLAVTAAQTDLLDQPSDLGVTLTTLSTGDEVEIQELEEPWVRVVTPLGSTGWLRTASLGVGGAPPEGTASDEPPAQPQPKRRAVKTPRRSRAPRPAT
jgi:hypothetical protein